MMPITTSISTKVKPRFRGRDMDGPSVGRMTNDQADHRFAAVPVTKQFQEPKNQIPNRLDWLIGASFIRICL
jgi:hypothetical protein